MAETISATDSRITFVGRAMVQDDAYRFDFPSTYFRVAFTGKTLAMRVTDTKRNFYAVWLNSPTSAEPTHIVEVKGTDTIIDLITLADTKTSKLKEHQVVIWDADKITRHHLRWLDCLTDSMDVSLSQLREIVKGREA